MIAYPLTVEFLQDKLEVGFFSVLWIAILISMMLATEDIFTEDFNLRNSIDEDKVYHYNNAQTTLYNAWSNGCPN